MKAFILFCLLMIPSLVTTIKTNKEILRYSEFLERVIAKLDELIEEK